MTRVFARAETIDPKGGYAVRRPRACDPVGKALRGAFGNDDPLPHDIRRWLSVLDGLPG